MDLGIVVYKMTIFKPIVTYLLSLPFKNLFLILPIAADMVVYFKIIILVNIKIILFET